MLGRQIGIGMAVLVLGSALSLAQTPVLGGIDSPYPAVQSNFLIQVAGGYYTSGAVAYGPQNTPLELTGTNFGSQGTVQFTQYAKSCLGRYAQNSEQCAAPVPATVSIWTDTAIFLTVPGAAKTGLITVTVEGKTSNGLPFAVTNGTYSGSCPTFRPSNQLEITTTSLHDGTVGQSYSASLGATGGTGAYQWLVASGTLPAGLSLNASTGVISGTPTSATSMDNVTFQVTDSGSPRQANQALLVVTIEPQGMNSATVYSYSAGYDSDGNVSQYQDTVMGTWNFTYDAFNRVQSGSAVSGGTGSQDYTGQNLCWAYDSFGNRTAQVMQTTACPSQESSVTPVLSFDSGNHVSGGPLSYDAAGNVASDTSTGNSYLYDSEGRVCAVKSEASPGTYTITGYLYDADGIRVAKGLLSNCTSSTFLTGCSCDPTANGFQITENYVLGMAGEELSMLDGSNNWQRTNVYAGGKLAGTYDSNGLHFHLEDPLGTRRMQLSGNTGAVGQPETDIQSLPYGDALYSFPDQYAPATANDATPLHFTGKERDSESGNDYFEARYYSSAIGRFMSPDWSAREEPVPYASLDDPQTLNLYAYVRNNPLISVDTDGHAFCPGWCDPSGMAYQTQSETEAAERAYNAQAGYGKVTNAELGKRVAEQRAYLIGIFPNEKTKLESNDDPTIFHEYMCLKYGDCGPTKYDPSPVLIQVGATVDPNSIEIHHMLPQNDTMKQFFAKRGLDVEDFTKPMTAAEHRLSPDGIHTKGGGDWTGVWRNWIAKNPNATRAQILRQLAKMRKDFGI